MVDSACTCTCTHYCIKPFLNKPPIVALSQAPKPSLYAPYQQYRRPSLVFRCVGDWQLCSEYSLYLNCQRWGGFLPSVSRYVPTRFISHIIPYTVTALSTGTSITLYGTLAEGASWYLEPDGIPKNVLAKASFSIDTPSVILTVDNLQDGDHQLYGEVSAINNGTIKLHYFESVLLRVLTHYSTLSADKLTLPCPGLKILLEPASSFSVLARMHQTYLHRQSLWTTLPRIL